VRLLLNIALLLTASQKKRLAGLLVLMCVVAIFETAGVASILPFLAIVSNPQIVEQSAFLKYAKEMLAIETNKELIVFSAGIVFMLLALANFLSATTNWQVLRFASLVEHGLSVRLLREYLHRPYSEVSTSHTAELSKNILTEIGRIIVGIVMPTLQIFVRGVVAFSIIVMLVIIEPVVAMATAGIFGVMYALVYSSVRKRLGKIGSEVVSFGSDKFRIATEALSAIKELKLYGCEDTYVDRYAGPSLRMAEHIADNNAIAQIPRYVLETMVLGGFLIVVLHYALTRDNFHDITPILALYAFAGYRLMPALQQVFSSVTVIRFTHASLERILADLSHSNQANCGPLPALYAGDLNNPLKLTHAIRISDVTFVYPGRNQPAANSLSFSIKQGLLVGFVGKSGSGKSTTADLITGLLSPGAGKIFVDQALLDKDLVRKWQNSIGYVPQTMLLVDDSVERNIAFGVPDREIDSGAVVHAAKLAHIHTFITEELPQGYKTKIGERGVQLSGGQRQRLAIARALYRRPGLIILDEATSALDALTERGVLEAIRGLKGSHTVIMISHRLSAVRGCDEIFVFDSGQVCAQGTYEDLLHSSENFRHMVSADIAVG
jgi:ABC-type multidrug transport system fused ATPase/permease subunit